MFKEIIEDYLHRINVKKYSIININSLDEISIISNLSHRWEKDFINRKLHMNSDILLKAKSKITPFKWSAKKIENEDIRKLSEKYEIFNGVTFFIRINYSSVIFTMYFNEGDEFVRFYDKTEGGVFYDIMSIFEVYYEVNKKNTLTGREKEVMSLLKIGKTYAEISQILGISERTVRFHISNILRKFDVTSVRYAIFKGAVEGLI